jgi:glucose/arabinose dehydrogenase
MGTLREQSLVFMTLDSSFTPTQTTMVNMGERIRDLDVLPNGAMIASTDSGKLLVMTLRKP